MTIWTLFLLSQLLYRNILVNGQGFGSVTEIQEFLNNFCPPESGVDGCSEGAIINPGAALPTRRPIAPAVTTPRPPAPNLPPRPPLLSPSGCTGNGKKCSQLPNKCVPPNFDCNLLNLGITCRVPSDYGMVTQVLLCGDGTPPGVRCGSDITVPILTVLFVRCQGNIDETSNLVTSLDVQLGPGDDGGAGVYMCSASGSWDPQFQSPFLRSLTVSCRNAGCGGVPHPSSTLPVHRRWPMVRGIFKGGRLHCTATLVSREAVVTAAHCLTSSTVSNRPDSNADDYEIEIPGPFNSPVLRVRANEIRIHPRYDYNNGELRHDVGVVFFTIGVNYNFPTVCIADREYRAQIGNAQMVFSLDRQIGSLTEGPKWNSRASEWDSSCITTSTRVGGSCVDVLRVQQSQFCASHPGISMNPGSSGGPYLAEVSNGVKESWVLMGVLSRFSNSSSCSRDHSIYGQVADDSRWLKECVFDRECN
ncbi:hypothetical protein SK128_016325 [Halocaridina rubra]|uniref:Peptidase S1 domain-containing protein n=1 Tax=Halocaridina rubra TaxID=373956 RepID=A0AAN8WND7_HALRR